MRPLAFPLRPRFPLSPAADLRQKAGMNIQAKALGVHLFTATGAVFAMLATLAAVQEKWSLMFIW